MSLATILSNLQGLLIKIIDGFKYLLAAFYIRRSTRIETEKNALEKANKSKTKQLDISAGSPERPSSVRERMRNDRL